MKNNIKRAKEQLVEISKAKKSNRFYKCVLGFAGGFAMAALVDGIYTAGKHDGMLEVAEGYTKIIAEELEKYPIGTGEGEA